MSGEEAKGLAEDVQSCMQQWPEMVGVRTERRRSPWAGQEGVAWASRRRKGWRGGRRGAGEGSRRTHARRWPAGRTVSAGRAGFSQATGSLPDWGLWSRGDLEAQGPFLAQQ